MEELVKVFRGLADETRLRILGLLLLRECCVCEVMEVLGISQTRASRNLGLLQAAGLLRRRREGLWSYYSVASNFSRKTGGLLSAIEERLACCPAVRDDRRRLAKQPCRGEAGCRTPSVPCLGSG